MALNLVSKKAELEALQAAIFLAETIKNSGAIPQSSTFAKNFPQFSLNDILFILANSAGARSKQELQDKIAEVLEILTILKKTIEAQSLGFEKITVISPAVEESPQFSKLQPEQVLNQLEAARLRVKAVQNLEWTKDFTLPENPQPTPTFYLAPHNPAEPAPVFEKPAKILVQEGLASEDGIPAENYSEKLQDPILAQKLESEIGSVILQEHLENLLARDLSGAAERLGWAEKLTDAEKRVVVNSFAKDLTEIITWQILQIPPENLPQIQEQFSKNLKEKFNQDRKTWEEFLDTVFAANPNFANMNFRQVAVGQMAEAVLQTLTNFSVETVKVILDIFKPKLTISFYKFINSNPVRQDLDYYIIPKSPAEFEADYHQTKGDFETLIKAALTQTKTQTATGGS